MRNLAQPPVTRAHLLKIVGPYMGTSLKKTAPA